MKFHSHRKKYFQILLILLGLAVAGYLYLQGSMFWMNQQITDKKAVIAQQSTELDAYKQLPGYNKLQAVKILESKQTTMPWSDHITKVITMLNELKNITPSGGDSIALSDFNVSLDKITLKGKVSNLLLLYYSDATKGVVSLFDRFSALDFVKDIRIQTYDKVGDNNYFEFVLEANVVNDAGTK